MRLDSACGSTGSAVMVCPDSKLYAQAQPSDAAEIIEEHIKKGNVVKRLALMELGNR